MTNKPTVLFVCLHNANRSQVAAGYLRHLAGDRVDVLSAGPRPAERLNPAAVDVMSEEGIDIAAARPQPLTDDALEDWFPHPSPDGRWLVFVSFPAGTQGHPPNQDVVLRRLPLPGDDVLPRSPIRELVSLFGGQGTINVNSWSPDGGHFAYVRYSRDNPQPAGEP